ncbi:MAG: A/G-specific adenine glycosylase [Fibrobacter sp.]|nr:A/G-specific adenine glycosylase [Fibrobacter sp.]
MNSESLKKLRAWFLKNAASLPWRPSDLNALRDPYAVWISETMLQQTQVATVKDYFIRWMKRFPSVKILAKANEAEVFNFWQGLGYYSRARNILKTAAIICDHYGGKFPQTRAELEALPGIGAYTAGAILSLGFHQREAILDGNLVRIFSRMNLFNFLPTDKDFLEIYWNYAREVADSPKAHLHNEALMELGRTICKAKNPLCENCPLASACLARQKNQTSQFPPKKVHIQKEWHGTVLVIESKDGKILALENKSDEKSPKKAKHANPFFKNQKTLPHFESPKNAPAGLPMEAEYFVNADQIEDAKACGSFRHNITVHKMECEVMLIRLKKTAKSCKVPQNTLWIPKKQIKTLLVSNFCHKSLNIIELQ